MKYEHSLWLIVTENTLEFLWYNLENAVIAGLTSDDITISFSYQNVNYKTD